MIKNILCSHNWKKADSISERAYNSLKTGEWIYFCSKCNSNKKLKESLQ